MFEKLNKLLRKLHETTESEKIFDDFNVDDATKIVILLEDLSNALTTIDRKTFNAIEGGSILSDIDFFIRDTKIAISMNERHKNSKIRKGIL